MANAKGLRWVRFVTKSLANPTIQQIKDLVDSNAERETLIAALLRLTLHLSAKWANKYPTKSDDIAGVALLTLVTAVDSFLLLRYQAWLRRQTDLKDGLTPQVSTDNNIAGYVSYRINRAVGKYVSEDRMIRVPQRTIQDRVQKGTIDSLNMSVNAEGVNAEGGLLETLIERLQGRNAVYGLWAFSTPETEVRDQLEVIFSDAVDRRIMELRILGFDDNEIGTDLSLDASVITEKRLAIQRELRKALE